MTVVVADTSPLSYLVLIGQIEVLHRLYGKVFVPPEVLAELASSGAPPQVFAVDSGTARVAGSTTPEPSVYSGPPLCVASWIFR